MADRTTDPVGGKYGGQLALHTLFAHGTPLSWNAKEVAVYGNCAGAETRMLDFRLWLQADIQSPEIEVCFTPRSGHSPRGPRRQQIAISGSRGPGFNTRAIPLVCYFSRISAKGRPVNEEGVERKPTTILAADVVGHSRLMGRDEARALTRLKSLRKELMQPNTLEAVGVS